MKEVNQDDSATDYGERLGVSRFTLGELADKLGVSKGYVSRRAGKSKDVKGHDVASWAVRDGTGRIDHYRVPDSAFEDDTPDQPRENAGTEPETEVKTMSVRDIARENRERREEEDRQRNQERLEADRKRRERSARRHKERMEAIKARTEAKQEQGATQDAESATESDEGGNVGEGTPATRRSGVALSLFALGGAAVVSALLGGE